MPNISVSVNGQSFTLACDEGEEAHLRSLVRYFDHHVQDLGRSMGSAGDLHLFLMAGLMVADELSSAVERLNHLESEITALKERRGDTVERQEEAERQVARALNGAATRLEGIIARVNAEIDKETAGNLTPEKAPASQNGAGAQKQ